MNIFAKRDPRELLVLAALIFVFVGGWQLQRGHKDMVPATVVTGKGVVRVIAPDQERVKSTLSPYGMGFERELVDFFARATGYKVEWITAESQEQALSALREGRADLLIGSGHEPEELPGVTAGPAYAHYQPVLVRAEDPGAGKERPLAEHVLVHTATPVDGGVSGLLPEVQPASVTQVPQRFGLPAVLNSLHARTAPLAVLSSLRFRLWQPFYLNLRPAETLAEEVPCRWFWAEADERFAQAMADFWASARTGARLAELTERYFGFFPKKTPYPELEALYEIMARELPKYAPLIAEHSARRDLDPLLLAALIYQESRFDPRAKSRTGATGLLQFTTAAAEHFDLDNRYDPADSIRAGSDFLGTVHEQLEPLELDPWDRWFFTLAAYNQGPGNLQAAMDLAKKLGMSGRTWRELKEVYPLLEKKKYAGMVKKGTCRGREAVRFVDSVRYYYYILHGIVRLSRPEAKHLGPLLDSLVGGSVAAGDAPALPRPLS